MAVALVSVALTGTAREASAACVSPAYEVDGRFGAGLHIALKRPDVTIDKLICLAGALKERFASDQDIFVFIFDSAAVARAFRREIDDISPTVAQSFKHLRAMYVHHAKEGTETLMVPL